jgi:hypothetical protein
LTTTPTTATLTGAIIPIKSSCFPSHRTGVNRSASCCGRYQCHVAYMDLPRIELQCRQIAAQPDGPRSLELIVLQRAAAGRGLRSRQCE